MSVHVNRDSTVDFSKAHANHDWIVSTIIIRT